MTLLTTKTLCIAEYEEKQSRFIAHLVEIEHFDETLERLRTEHPKASHHVTAVREINSLSQISEKARDDGEPAGTSGMPVLKTLIGSNLINVGMIVTRYFGGTKLGTGGLARAYAAASNLAISNAELIEWHPRSTYECSVEFARSSDAEQLIKQLGLNVLAREFLEEGVQFKLEGTEQAIEAFAKAGF